MKKIFFLTIALCLMTFAKAQWVNDPASNTILAQGNNQYGEIYISTHEASGNTYIQWSNMRSYGWAPSLQKVDLQGVPQWGENGIDITGHSFDSYSMGIAMTTLSDGSVISAFADIQGKCVVTKITPEGTLAWEDGSIVALDMGACMRIQVAAGNDGGFWITSFDEEKAYLRYYNGDGTPRCQQVVISPINGDEIGFTQLVVDNENNVFVVYQDEEWAMSYYYKKSIYVTKYSPEGAQLSPPTLLMAEKTIGGSITHYALPDGLGGGYVWICHPAFNNVFEVLAFHFDANGNNTFDNPDGIFVCEPDGQNYHLEANATVDPTTHDLVVAYRSTDASSQSIDGLFVNRIGTTGDKIWGGTGKVLVHPSSQNSISNITIDAFPDGSGEAILYAFSTDYINNIINTIGIDAEGVIIWNNPFCSTASQLSGASNTSGFHNGQLVFAWEDHRNGVALYGQNIQIDGTLGPFTDGVADIENNPKIKIYPNPAVDELYVETDGEADIEIYNLQGQLIESKHIVDHVALSTENLSTGMFLVRVKTKSSSTVQKVIIK